jgi:O-antigen/teichoic acid export membrane protein
MLIAIGVCVFLNVILNLIFVPRHGMIASSLILLATSTLYAGFMVVLALILSKKI